MDNRFTILYIVEIDMMEETITITMTLKIIYCFMILFNSCFSNKRDCLNAEHEKQFTFIYMHILQFFQNLDLIQT